MILNFLVLKSSLPFEMLLVVVVMRSNGVNIQDDYTRNGELNNYNYIKFNNKNKIRQHKMYPNLKVKTTILKKLRIPKSLKPCWVQRK